MNTTCEFYGIEEEKITMEVDESFINEKQVFHFEGKEYIIISVIKSTPIPKANVMPLAHYRALNSESA